MAFVRNVLANVPADALVVACFHIPLRTVVGTDNSFSVENVSDFLGALSSHANSVSFAGHTHTNEHFFLDDSDGFTAGRHHHHVLAAVSGSCGAARSTTAAFRWHCRPMAARTGFTS